MARHFAEVKNGIVLRVILADPEFCAQIGGTWIETFNPNEQPEKERGAVINYAGIGHEVVTDNAGKAQTCAPKAKARDSWILDKNVCAYVAPVSKPQYNAETEALVWNEKQVAYAVISKDQAVETQKALDADFMAGK